jgi:hypothetical protein
VLDMQQHHDAMATAAAAAAAAVGGTDDTSLLAALAAGGSLMSPSGSSLPAGLNTAGRYDSSLPTPSSRGPQLEMPMPHGGRYSSNEVTDYAAAAAAVAVYGGGLGGGLPGLELPGQHEADAAAAAAGMDPRRLVSRYNSGSLEDAAAAAAMTGGATSSGGRSASPTGNSRGWARGSRGEVRGGCQVYRRNCWASTLAAGLITAGLLGHAGGS